MSDTDTFSQVLPVLDGADFVVALGANLGDGLSFARDMTLDDTYRLQADASRLRLALRPEGKAFRILPRSETGHPGAQVFLDSALTFMSPAGETVEALVFVMLDAAQHVQMSYLLPLAALHAQTDYALVGIDTDGARELLARVACVSFTRGTHITLPDGTQRPIEELRPGDRVLTRDAGAREIRWIGHTTIRASGAFAPIRIRAGALNNLNDLIVSPDHRLFIYQRRDHIGAGRPELLVRVRHLVNGESVIIEQGGFVDYFQLLFDDHHIVFAEGIAAESLLLDTTTAPALPQALLDRMKDHSGGYSLSGLEVPDSLLNHPDAANLLRRASSG